MQGLKLPTTRYYGSKRKLISRIWEELEKLDLKFESTLDVFGGSGMFSYYSKLNNKRVIYNDIFRFNFLIGKALILNTKNELSNEDILFLINPLENYKYKSIIEQNYKDIYYTDEENRQIDIIIQNIDLLDSESKKNSAFYLLFQSCLIKRPFNLFHRKNLNLRVNFKSANFGNKVTWDKSFKELFFKFNDELNKFVFDNGKTNKCINKSALDFYEEADLIYIDPPYFANKGSHVSYFERYHFLEGLAFYGDIEAKISDSKKHKEILINCSSEFEKKEMFVCDLKKLVSNYSKSIIVISYRNNGIPNIDDIRKLLSEYKSNCKVVNLGNYGYALNRNNINNFEYLIIGY